MSLKNMLKALLPLNIFLLINFSLNSQVDFKWQEVEVKSEANFRGLSVVSDDIIWISGSEGTVLKSIDGGANWIKLEVPDADSLDFRDIEAFDENLAYIISAGTPGTIYKTTDGGTSWKQQYYTEVAAIFFDGFDFKDPDNGLAFGDPIDGKLFLVNTTDGKTWLPVEALSLPKVADDEYAFAASGTGIQIIDNTIYIVTGGSMARVYKSSDRGANWEVFDTPMKTGKAAGNFSVHFWNAEQGVIVGGDYEDFLNKEANAAYTSDGGETWTLASTLPNGYRSCVARSPDLGLMLAVGTSGTDLSSDDGRNWMLVDEQKLNTCQFGSRTVWAVGGKGMVAKIVIY